MFNNDSSERIFWLGEKGLDETEDSREIEEKSQVGGDEYFEEYGIVERQKSKVFSIYHNSIVGHHGGSTL